MVRFMRAIPIKIGQQFGRLTVKNTAERDKKGQIRWLCLCLCGADVVVASTRLMKGSVRSCGCLRRETTAATGRRVSRKHGHFLDGIQSITYHSWCNMVYRCTNKNSFAYKNYGGRGITIFQSWRESFTAFLHDVGERPSVAHTLDRIDVNGNYEPGNVRWALIDVQMNNRRNNIYITIDGITRTVAQWSKLSGLPYYTIWGRVKRGWPTNVLLVKAHHGLSCRVRSG